MAATLGTTIDSIVKTSQNFAYAVKNPVVYIAAGDAGWSTQDTSANYMWQDKNVERYADGKSIFDPSPIGWRVPINGVWSDFVKDSTTTVVADKVSTYTAGSLTANYYAVGRRQNATSSLHNIGTEASYWLSTPSTTTVGIRLFLNASTVNGSHGLSRSYGSSIRAIRE